LPSPVNDMKWRPLVLMLGSSLFVSIAQLFYKVGASRLELDISSLLSNWPLAAGVLSYGLALILMLEAYKRAPLTLLYPVIAASYIWVILLATAIFPDEVISLSSMAGALLIVLGISLIGAGSR